MKLIIKTLLNEQLVLEASMNNITEIVNLFESNEDNTFVWDLSKEKIDKSLDNINNASKGRKYLILFLDKIKVLPKSVKVRLIKYVIASLIGVMSYNSISSIVSDKEPEISKEIVKSIPQIKEPVKPVEPEIKAEPIVKKKEIPTQVSDSLIDFLKHEEGDTKQKGEPVLKAYTLGDGKVTVGWGHAENIKKSNIKPGQTITRKKAEELLIKDIKHAEDAMNRITKDWAKKGIKMDISQGMYDAMVSMIYNMGVGNFRTSEFIQLVKQGKYDEAKEKILTTNITFPGHKPRREKEAQMFSTGLNENAGETNSVSVNYLKGLLNNTTNKTARKILTGWIAKGGDKITLTPKQYNLLQVIKRGGPSSSFYGPKNEYIEPADETKVDPKELEMGIEVEMEHTRNPGEAKIIALQHLAEDPKYYTKLASLGL
jgi:GH24 family phage-related lysozyme (muramidase)